MDILNKFNKDPLEYIVNVFGEEGIFRILMIGIFCAKFGTIEGILLSSIIYAVVHLLYFKWQMVVACLPVGLLLGTIYFNEILPGHWNYLSVVVLHLIIAALGRWSGVINQWEK